MADRIIEGSAFTLKSTSIASQILTSDTEISDAYDPDSRPHILPERIQAVALWDTGATNTVISCELASKLGLNPTGIVETFHAGGTSFCNTYIINVSLPNKVDIHGLEVSEAPLSDPSFDMLIGMDIITLGDFAFTNKDGQSWFSFRFPSLARTDYVSEITQASGQGLSRNAPCWCGSGKKFKNCHGSSEKIKDSTCGWSKPT